MKRNNSNLTTRNSSAIVIKMVFNDWSVVTALDNTYLEIRGVRYIASLHCLFNNFIFFAH